MSLRSWHWSFMAQPADLPERMMGAVPPEWYITQKCKSSIGDHIVGSGVFTQDAFNEYVRCFNDKTIRGSCGDYRAAATCDYQMDVADKDKKVTAPLVVLWGDLSHAGRAYGNLLDVWGKHASDLRGGKAVKCGHYVNEEAPDETYAAMMQHFGS
jgi:haloacetate dehalogenase